jgi:hypothetical protein
MRRIGNTLLLAPWREKREGKVYPNPPRAEASLKVRLDRARNF